MTNYGQKYYRVYNEYCKTETIKDENGNNTVVYVPGYETSADVEEREKGKLIIFLKAEDNITWEKIGIQAPPGTKFSFNGTDFFIMGRTGVYEIEETISSLMFQAEPEYAKDEINTAALENAAERMLKAAQAYYKYRDLGEETQDDKYYENWQKYYNGDSTVGYTYDEASKEINMFEIATTEATSYFTYEGQYQAEKTYLKAKWGVYNQTGNFILLQDIIVDYVDTNATTSSGGGK